MSSAATSIVQVERPRSQKAVESAQTVAALRAISARADRLSALGNDPFARHFLDCRHWLLTQLVPRPLLRRIVERRAPGSLGFSLIRTREFDQALTLELERGAMQIVLLGAGYDTRALRFADLIQSRLVFELDHPATQERKLDRLSRACLEFPDNVLFVPVDFNAIQGRFERALLDAGFDQSLTTLFLWEGVSYYLPESSVRRVMNFVRACGRNSSIVFDYALRAFVEGDHGTFGGVQVARWLERIGEPFHFGLAPDEVEPFLSSCGLTLERDLGPEELEQLHLPRDCRTLGHVRIACARAV